MSSEHGLDDFVKSRDLHENTCLHYIALFDNEDFIITLLKSVAESQDFALRIRNMATALNSEQRTAMDFFARGKSSSYGIFHETIQSLTIGGLPETELTSVIARLQVVKKLSKSPSLARMPSTTSLRKKRGSASS